MLFIRSIIFAVSAVAVFSAPVPSIDPPQVLARRDLFQGCLKLWCFVAGATPFRQNTTTNTTANTTTNTTTTTTTTSTTST